jgi:hypothetical protein
MPAALPGAARRGQPFLPFCLRAGSELQNMKYRFRGLTTNNHVREYASAVFADYETECRSAVRRIRSLIGSDLWLQ